MRRNGNRKSQEIVFPNIVEKLHATNGLPKKQRKHQQIKADMNPASN